MLLNYLQVINVDNNKIIIFISLLEFALLCFVFLHILYRLRCKNLQYTPHPKKILWDEKEGNEKNYQKGSKRREYILIYIFCFIYLFIF